MQTWNDKILQVMMPGWEYRTCDLVSVYFDAGSRLRKMFKRGIVDRRKTNKFTYYKKLN